MSINRNKCRNSRIIGISRQGHYMFPLNMLHMLKKIRGKLKHDEERNISYKRNPNVFRKIFRHFKTEGI